MTIQQALLSAIQRLRKSKKTAAILDAEVLLSYVLKKTRMYLLAHPETRVTPITLRRFNGLITRHLRGEPIAYCLGHREFYGLDFSVNKHVLIPRPETELLVEKAITFARHHEQKQPNHHISIADIGTGSGCIAVTLARYLPQANIVAIDMSINALRVAKKNARTHGASRHIKFLRGSLTKPLQHHSIDLAVANLPYGTTREAKQVLCEPSGAIDGGRDGMKFLVPLIKSLPDVLRENGMALLEIDPRRSKRIIQLVRQTMPAAIITIHQDLNHWDRIVEIQNK